MNPRHDLRRCRGLHLALGGGAARGLAHVGILKVLAERNIPIASICGTSMGALVGAMFALNPDPRLLEDRVLDFLHSEHFNRARFAFIKSAQRAREDNGRGLSVRQWFRHGYLLGKSMAFGCMIPFEEFERQVAELVPDRRFDDTAFPFFVMGLDLIQRREVVFAEGSLRAAVMASSAIPGVFPPVTCDGVVYVDGGWINKVPATPLFAFGAPSVLAVDVGDDTAPEVNLKRGTSVMLQAYAAAHFRLQQIQVASATRLWRPPLDPVHWSDFGQAEKAIQIGAEFAREQMDAVRALLRMQPLYRLKRKMMQWLCKNAQPNAAGCVSFDVRAIAGIHGAVHNN